MLTIIEGLPPDVDGDRRYGQGNALRILPEVAHTLVAAVTRAIVISKNNKVVFDFAVVGRSARH